MGGGGGLGTGDVAKIYLCQHSPHSHATFTRNLCKCTAPLLCVKSVSVCLDMYNVVMVYNMYISECGLVTECAMLGAFSRQREEGVVVNCFFLVLGSVRTRRTMRTTRRRRRRRVVVAVGGWVSKWDCGFFFGVGTLGDTRAANASAQLWRSAHFCGGVMRL